MLSIVFIFVFGCMELSGAGLPQRQRVKMVRTSQGLVPAAVKTESGWHRVFGVAPGGDLIVDRITKKKDIPPRAQVVFSVQEEEGGVGLRPRIRSRQWNAGEHNEWLRQQHELRQQRLGHEQQPQQPRQQYQGKQQGKLVAAYPERRLPAGIWNAEEHNEWLRQQHMLRQQRGYGQQPQVRRLEDRQQPRLEQRHQQPQQQLQQQRQLNAVVVERATVAAEGVNVVGDLFSLFG